MHKENNSLFWPVVLVKVELGITVYISKLNVINLGESNLADITDM